MKRDMDLIREIMLEIEARYSISGPASANNLGLEDWDEELINYNMLLLLEAGFVIGNTDRYDDQPNAYITRLTWSGHEFLDSARDNHRWGKVKDASAKIGGVAFDVLKPLLFDLARQAARQALNLPF